MIINFKLNRHGWRLDTRFSYYDKFSNTCYFIGDSISMSRWSHLIEPETSRFANRKFEMEIRKTVSEINDVFS